MKQFIPNYGIFNQKKLNIFNINRKKSLLILPNLCLKFFNYIFLNMTKNQINSLHLHLRELRYLENQNTKFFVFKICSLSNLKLKYYFLSTRTKFNFKSKILLFYICIISYSVQFWSFFSKKLISIISRRVEH